MKSIKLPLPPTICGALLCAQILPATVLYGVPLQRDSAGLVGQRVIMLSGWGAVQRAENDRPRTSLGINLVSEVLRVDGNRVWLGSTGGDESGWVDRNNVLPLPSAIAYFDREIDRFARTTIWWQSFTAFSPACIPVALTAAIEIRGAPLKPPCAPPPWILPVRHSSRFLRPPTQAPTIL